MKTKVKITSISKKDAYYEDKKFILGLVGYLYVEEGLRKGYYGGRFIASVDSNWKRVSKEMNWSRDFFFACIKVEEVK